MNIIINQEVKDYLRAMGRKTITIYSELMSSCWSPKQDIFVILKEPAVLENYNEYEVDGIKIYLYKDAVLKEDSITIEIAKYASDFANKELDVYGLEV